ncbi:DnaB helicase C-terminal domain-containing protein [Macrococcus bovicus]|uniref:Damage-inducible protein n=1 Tax=Macrococcus bovicus TaxID=69968 RepID=A0A4R6BW71_9STAP|nr:DnaB helicase C-terminal domain-containing protein [Macrococcus bovicus]TDM12683.1 damage-inducible protein [Macrococcus bovicus]
MIEFEENLLASLIKFPKLYDDLQVTPNMISDESIKATLQFFREKGFADVASLYQVSGASNQQVIDKKTIGSMRNDKFIFESHFKQYQIDVINAYKQRMIISAAQDYIEKPTVESQNFLQQTITQLNEIDIDDEDTKTDVLLQIMDTITSDAKSGILTGFKSLDGLTDGFDASQFNIIGARPSIGKTAFAIAMGLQMAQKNTVHFVSLETKDVKVTTRILSNLSNVPLKKFKNGGMMTSDEIELVTKWIGYYQNLDFHVHDKNNITPAKLRSIIAKHPDKTNIIFLDYIQLMKSDDKSKDRRLELEQISRELKIVAKETNSVIIALAQLSRGVEQRQDKRPIMSDLKEASGLEQDADIIMMLYRDDYYTKQTDPDNPGKSEIECIIAKNKDGETGTVKMDFYKASQRFYG